MTIRLLGALLCGGLLVLVASATSFAQSGRNNTVQGNYSGTSRGILVSPYQTSGGGEGRRKSNTSDRMGGGSGKGAAGRATTVKSSKSNTSDRMYGGGFQGDNNSPRPQDRKASKRGSGTGKPAIFDRWGRTDGGGARRF
jgi:hypothetical protein